MYFIVTVTHNISYIDYNNKDFKDNKDFYNSKQLFKIHLNLILIQNRLASSNMPKDEMFYM